MEEDKMLENVKVVVSEIDRKKPTDVKGEFIKSVALSSTMGPGVRVSPREKL